MGERACAKFVKLIVVCLVDIFTYVNDVRVSAGEKHVRHVVCGLCTVCACGSRCAIMSGFSFGSVSTHCKGFVPYVCRLAYTLCEGDVVFGGVMGTEGVELVWEPCSAACPILRVSLLLCSIHAISSEGVLMEVPLVV